MRRSSLGVAVAVFAIACAGGLAQLYTAHPAEDAFILFKYAENVAHGHGIVYYAGGPRTEGATDFLWLMLLAAIVFAGGDVAVAAVVWNALGAALAAALLDREIVRSGIGGAWRWALLVVPLSIPFVAGAPAAYLGFSSLLYQGLILAAFVVTAGNSSRAAAAVPWMGLVITLFRPDGAFFAAAFVIAAGARELRASGRGRFLASTLGAVLVGAIYFGWRWAYFGELLPLPLHVKSHGVIRGPLADQIRQYLPWLNGIGLQLMWLKSALGPAPIAAALAALALFPPRSGGEMRPFWHSARIAAGGSALFLGALSFAFQAQNVHFRYQAPVVLLLVFLLGSLAARRIAEHPAPLRRATVLALVLAGLIPPVAAGARAALASTRGGSYIDVLPARLAEVMQPGRTIALTDAGRLAYWTNTPIVDVAGLNYAPTALRPPSVAMLREIDPDVLLIHPGASVVDETFPPPSGDPAFFEIDRMQIERRIASPYRSVFDQGLERYAPTSNTATVAAAVMLRYLVERGDDYEVEVVRYQGGYRHVFAFRRKLPEAGEIREALAQSTSGQEYAPYAALKGFPFSRRFEVRLDDAAR